MSKQLNEQLAVGKARIVDAPAAKPVHQVQVDRNFGMPTAFYAVTAGLYLAFIGIMFAGFATSGLIVPMGIFAVFIIAGFGVPAVWVRLKNNESRPLTMGKFAMEGIMTHTGRLAPRDAAIQMLILPVLIVLWACIVVTIAALV